MSERKVDLHLCMARWRCNRARGKNLYVKNSKSDTVAMLNTENGRIMCWNSTATVICTLRVGIGDKVVWPPFIFFVHVS